MLNGKWIWNKLFYKSKEYLNYEIWGDVLGQSVYSQIT